MLEKEFSHVDNFTGYMATVARIVNERSERQRILDIPAGNGLLAARLREAGHAVTCADINRAKPDYVYADLGKPLPFPDGTFDTCLCLEGIEHVIDTWGLVSELTRITCAGGRIVLSLPNIQNVFSRTQFLCTGCYYQFTPWMGRHLAPGTAIDRGHISPLSFVQLKYLFEEKGARLASVSGDRWKKKWLIPFLLPWIGLGWFWGRRDCARNAVENAPAHRETLRQLFSAPLLFSRSIILVFVRTCV
jgi:SAM-dependent methyltransferase